jgi:hypothetical protein
MKSPPKQYPDDKAHELVEEFIHKNTRTRVKEPAKA